MTPHADTERLAPLDIRYRRDRDGNTILIVAASFVVLCGVAALVVDAGYARMVQAQMQATTDAAALGAVAFLDLTDSGLVAARDGAVGVAALNDANGEPVSIDGNWSNNNDGNVVTGIYDEETHTFTPSVDAAEVNAVKVQQVATGLDAMFSAVAFGRDELAAGSCSIAVQPPPTGAGSVPYYLPFSLPSCIYDTKTEGELADTVFVLNPAGVDTTGWGAVDEAPSAAWAKDHLTNIDSCMGEWEDTYIPEIYTGYVESECAPASIGDSIYLGNGMEQSALMELDKNWSDGMPWHEELWGDKGAQNVGSTLTTEEYDGYAWAGPVPIFDDPGDYCTMGGSWNENVAITGFAWAFIYDLDSQGSAAERNVYVKIDLDGKYKIGDSWGGPNLGVTITPPAKLFSCVDGA